MYLVGILGIWWVFWVFGGYSGYFVNVGILGMWVWWYVGMVVVVGMVNVLIVFMSGLCLGGGRSVKLYAFYLNIGVVLCDRNVLISFPE